MNHRHTQWTAYQPVNAKGKASEVSKGPKYETKPNQTKRKNPSTRKKKFSVLFVSSFSGWVSCTSFLRILLYLKYAVCTLNNEFCLCHEQCQQHDIPSNRHFVLGDESKTKEHEIKNPFTIQKIHTNRLQVEGKRLIEMYAQ